jgi:hypothetical protein
MVAHNVQVKALEDFQLIGFPYLAVVRNTFRDSQQVAITVGNLGYLRTPLILPRYLDGPPKSAWRASVIWDDNPGIDHPIGRLCTIRKI